MRARGAPTSTSSSSSASSSSTVPATGLGISVSTLSVDTSRSGSSTSTVSPTSLSQRVTVPSVTDSPRAGMVTSCDSPEPPEGLSSDFAAGASSSSSARSSSGSSSASGSSASSSSAESSSAESPESSPSPMTARSPPTSTSSSSSAKISCRTPEYGLGISVSTLSVDTSRSGSSTSTVSPTSLSQRVTVPSVTDSPRAGIFTVLAIVSVSLWLDQRKCSGLPASASAASPMASFWVGCPWMSDATSSGKASQFTMSWASPACSDRRAPSP